MSYQRLIPFISLFILFFAFLLSFNYWFNYSKKNDFEYQIIGPKLVNSLDKVKYRVIISNNQNKESVPIKVYYKGKILAYEKVSNEYVFNLDLSNQISNENDIELNFVVNDEVNIVKLRYEPDFKSMVFTDKPLYQPGQTVYLKGIVFQNGQPFNRQVQLSIQDPKSNKVFYKSINLKNGVFFEKFAISDLVIHGIYKVILDYQGKTLATNSFEVKKYTLPKFKIDLSFSGNPDIFEIGKTYKTSINCSYFFGKKLSNADININVYSFDVGFNKIYSLTGRTDRDGRYSFDLKIPSNLVGIDQNKGILKIEIEVEDKAGQTEKKEQIIEVFQKPIIAHIIPSNRLVEGLENEFYLLVSYANSKPGNFKVKFIEPFKKEFLLKDFSQFKYKPKRNYEKFVFDVFDDKGNKERFEYHYDTYSSDDKFVFIFRDKATYKVGEILKFKLYSNSSTNVYLDFFVKSNNSYRTVYSDSLYLNKGKEDVYELSLNPNFVGQLIVRAYFIKENGTISDNFKIFFVEDPNELNFDVKKEKDIYKVRDKLKMIIKTQESASIFVDIVDEALLYLAKSEPELLKLYLKIEKELLDPKYEVHSFSDIKEVILKKQDNILKAMLDKLTNDEYFYNFRNSFNNISSIQLKTERTLAKMKSLYVKCYNYYYSNKRFPDSLQELGIKKIEYLDEWKTPIKLKVENNYLRLISAGADKKFDTNDDIFYPNERNGIVVFEEQVRTFDKPFILKKSIDKSEITGTSQINDKTNPNDFIVRSYFPETFYSGLISVDKNYILSLDLPDSITNWKAQFLGVSKDGKLGSKTIDITVFQDFFIDIDNPLYLTQGDEISIPVIVYNYTKETLKVNVEIKKENWFDLLDDIKKEVLIDSNSNGSVYFRIKARNLGINNLTVFGYSNNFKDAISRQVEVIPNGFVNLNSLSAYVTKEYSRDFYIPTEAIDGSKKAYLYVYPSFSSQLLSGLDTLLSLPYGCFEQTSSINYPNILILKYLRNRKISNPSIEMKAEYYLNIGYQRLITFEVDGGGFSWFGDKPANKVLTAFGLMEFKDMSDVFFVDNSLIERTKKFLIDQQNSDGSWDPDQNYLHEESWGNIQKQKLTVTSYILMSLLDNDEKIFKQYSENISKGLDYIDNEIKKGINQIDNYTLGLILNIFANIKDKKYENNISFILKELERRAVSKGEEIYWKGQKNTLFYGQDIASDIETTAIISIALIKIRKMDLAIKVIKYLINSKDSRGVWYSTQPTILALKAITNFDSNKSIEKNSVKILVNNREIKLDFEKDDLAYKIVDLTSYILDGKNSITIKSDKEILVDIFYNYYLPFSYYNPSSKILDIETDYDRSGLNLNNTIKSKVKIENLSNKTLEMVVLDLGIPPGFNVDSSKIKLNKKVKNVEQTYRQIIVYFEKIEPKEKIVFEYDMFAKYPLKVKTPLSKIYEYYNPSNNYIKEGKLIEVK